MRRIDLSRYELVVISPRNYFLYTPLLPSATVGTVKGASLAESVRKILLRRGGAARGAHFFEAQVDSVDFTNKTVTCFDSSAYVVSGHERFRVEYDKLVISVGAGNATFNVPGVRENAFFLSSLEDAQRIRERLIDVLESHSTPAATIDNKCEVNLVVVGGGPAGVEVVGELCDFVEEEVTRAYPSIHARVYVVEALDHLLQSFNAEISRTVRAKFEKRGHIMSVMTGQLVTQVKPDALVVKDKKTGEVRELPCQLVIWSTGIATTDLTKRLIEQLDRQQPGSQRNKRALTVSDRLMVKGLPGDDSVFAIGDCSTIEARRMQDRLVELFAEIAGSEAADATTSLEQLVELFRKNQDRYPQVRAMGEKLF